MDNVTQPLSEEQESVKNLVLAKMTTLQNLRIKKRQLKERLESFMMADEGYKTALAEWNDKRKALKEVKEKLAQQPEIYALKDEIKELTQEFNQTKKDIAEYLLIFETQTGQLSFIDPMGNKVEIVKSATPRIVKVSFREKMRKN